MDENNINQQEHHENDDHINKMYMDDKGHIHQNKAGEGVVTASPRMFILLGWFSAALALLVSPFFGALGILFGVLANKRVARSGNIVIIVNIAFAAISMILNLLFYMAIT